MLLKSNILKLFLLMVFLEVIAVPSGAGSDFETILEGADLGDMLVTSGSGSVLFEYIRMDSLSAKASEDDQTFLAGLSFGEEAVINNQEHIEISFSFNDPKMRCDENSLNRLPTGRRYVQNWQWAYNGEKMDLFRLDGLGEKGLIIPMGSIRTENVIPVHRFDPRYSGMKIFGTPVGSFLRGSFGDRTVEGLEVVGEEMQDGILCKIIRGYIVGTGDTIAVWLAPSFMYRPKHVEWSSPDEIVVVHNSFREYSGGIWFPELVLKEEYYSEKSTGSKVLYTRETITISNLFELNIELPESLFEVEFPVGLMVYDYRIGQSIEIK